MAHNSDRSDDDAPRVASRATSNGSSLSADARPFVLDRSVGGSPSHAGAAAACAAEDTGGRWIPPAVARQLSSGTPVNSDVLIDHMRTSYTPVSHAGQDEHGGTPRDPPEADAALEPSRPAKQGRSTPQTPSSGSGSGSNRHQAPPRQKPPRASLNRLTGGGTSTDTSLHIDSTTDKTPTPPSPRSRGSSHASHHGTPMMHPGAPPSSHGSEATSVRAVPPCYPQPDRFLCRTKPLGCEEPLPWEVIVTDSGTEHPELGDGVLKFGGVCCEAPPLGIARAIWEITGVQIRAIAPFKAFHGLAKVWLADPARDAPRVKAAMHQRVWMNREAMFWVPLPEDCPEADPEVLEETRTALEAWASTEVPTSSHLPRRVMTCQDWVFGSPKPPRQQHPPPQHQRRLSHHRQPIRHDEQWGGRAERPEIDEQRPQPRWERGGRGRGRGR